MTLYLKAVITNLRISTGTFQYRSLLYDSQYAIDYLPGVWETPKLPGSLLFVYQNLTYVKQLLLNRIRYDPEGFQGDVYHGVMLWWCEAKGVEMYRNNIPWWPTDERMEAYWQDPETPSWELKWPYKPPEDSYVGTRLVQAVMLMSPVSKTDWENLT